MRHHRLGQSGLVDCELWLGAMGFGSKPGGAFRHHPDHDGSTALVRQVLEARVNFIATANIYREPR